MLTIRLQRIGRKNDPSFRVVLTDKKNSPKSGRFLEVLGTHAVKQGTVSLDIERIKYWMGKGAQVSPTLHNILISEKIIEGKKINVLSRKSPIKKEGEETPAASAAPAAPEAETPTEPAPAAAEPTPEIAAEPAPEAPADETPAA